MPIGVERDTARKRSLKSLAIFGGLPLFAEKLHVGRPNLGDTRQFFARLEDVLARRWLTNDGPCVQEFERHVARVVEVRHCVAVANATVGLQVALQAAGVTGSVILPSFTFVATAHAVSWLGLRPIFCDTAPGTYHIDPRRVESLIEPDTAAILGVHVWGEACDIAGLARIAQRRGVRLLFDAAHAFGCAYRGRRVGNFGAAEVFSFHATKFINAFEGGAICTNDDDVAEQARRIRDFGFADSDQVVCLGTNAKMHEASAAMGLTNLERVDEFVAVNRANFEAYRQGLSEIRGLTLFEYDRREDRNYQYVPVRVDQSQLGIRRDDLIRLLTAENVLARRYFYPGAHQAEPYRASDRAYVLPHTESLCQETMVLPTGTAVGPDEIAQICDLIRLVARHANELRERLADFDAALAL